MCHFIDLAMFIAGNRIKKLSGFVMEDPKGLEDTLVVNMGFEDGSVASVSYFSNGNDLLPKESLEVFSSGIIAVVDDFKTMRIYSDRHIDVKRYPKQDKGHREEINRFLSSIKEGRPAPIPLEEIYLTALATFKVADSIRTNSVVFF